MFAPRASEIRRPLRASSEARVGRRQAGRHQKGAQLVAVQAHGVRLVVEAGPADVHGRGVLDETLFGGVAVEPGDGRKPPADGGLGLAVLLEVAGVQLDVGAVGVEQAQLAIGAPGEELAQVQGVGLAVAPAVAGQEAGEGDHLRVGGAGVVEDKGRRVRHGGSFHSGAGLEPGRSAPSSVCHQRRYEGSHEAAPIDRPNGPNRPRDSRTDPAMRHWRVVSPAAPTCR